MSEDLIEILNAGANENAMVARVLRHVEDRPVCPRPEDFHEALKYDPAVVVRLHVSLSEESLAIDCRYRDGVEYTHDYRDSGAADRDAFVYDIRDADRVEVVHHRDSQFGEGWTCFNCRGEFFDPESEFVAARNEVRVTCPDCGAVDEIPQGTGSPHDLMTDGGTCTDGTERLSYSTWWNSTIAPTITGWCPVHERQFGMGSSSTCPFCLETTSGPHHWKWFSEDEPLPTPPRHVDTDTNHIEGGEA